MKTTKHAPEEDCKLIAYFDGEGWCLSVENSDGEEIALLAWPEAWPEKMTTEAIRLAGFEIV